MGSREAELWGQDSLCLHAFLPDHSLEKCTLASHEEEPKRPCLKHVVLRTGSILELRKGQVVEINSKGSRPVLPHHFLTIYFSPDWASLSTLAETYQGKLLIESYSGLRVHFLLSAKYIHQYGDEGPAIHFNLLSVFICLHLT